VDVDDGRAGVPPAADLVVAETPTGRPRFRGWVHAVAAPAALVAAVFLWRSAAPGPTRLSVAVFGVALVALYATSGLYHLPRWPARIRWWLSRADVAMIQLFIAASFTPIAVHALSGAWRIWSLAVVWSIGILGAALAASPISAPRWLSVVGYTAFACLAVVPLVRIVGVIPPEGLALIAVGALAYLVGGVVYARRHPDPWPRTFGFHEVFHVLVVLGGATHVVAVWAYTLPLA
jgi:hemolysin III